MKYDIKSFNTVIVGSGAAGLNAALHLFENGQKNIAVLTDLLGGGTSANTGSDKQTFYKLATSKLQDSPYEMARDLFGGGAMDGDIALVEAMLSLKEFYHLTELGVKFPYNEYGEYIGYKTDHDLKCRATSAGPLTSQEMFHCLMKKIRACKIKIFDKHEVIKLLTAQAGKDKRVTGLLAINKAKFKNSVFGLTLFNCENIIFATGGPAGIYQDSVYPPSQVGSIGVALAAGARAKNLTESQYGLASIKFRWNLSGTYQQVIPRYFSTDKNGGDEKDFLNEYFPSMGRLASAIFLKGYQWPFDPRKIEDLGSSLIDILVYQETNIKGRRVFMDFLNNPEPAGGLKKFDFKDLSKEAFEYLKKSNALLKLPIDRLKKMNPAAIDLYRNNGIDLTREPLEIAVCAQHNNGGLSGNHWWESNIKHLFPIGEVNGSHGVYRPGGSALNSGQVAGYRSALYIAKRYSKSVKGKAGKNSAKQFKAALVNIKRMLDAKKGAEKEVLFKFRKDLQERMSKYGAHIRSASASVKALEEAKQSHLELAGLKIKDKNLLLYFIKTVELSLTQLAYLDAIKAYIQKGGKSRGSYLIMDKTGIVPLAKLGNDWRYKRYSGELADRVLETYVNEKGKIISSFRKVRPLPSTDYWFENVWYDYRHDKIVK